MVPSAAEDVIALIALIALPSACPRRACAAGPFRSWNVLVVAAAALVVLKALWRLEQGSVCPSQRLRVLGLQSTTARYHATTALAGTTAG
jgi:hypothetical protein